MTMRNFKGEKMQWSEYCVYNAIRDKKGAAEAAARRARWEAEIAEKFTVAYEEYVTNKEKYTGDQYILLVIEHIVDRQHRKFSGMPVQIGQIFNFDAINMALNKREAEFYQSLEDFRIHEVPTELMDSVNKKACKYYVILAPDI